MLLTPIGHESLTKIVRKQISRGKTSVNLCHRIDQDLEMAILRISAVILILSVFHGLVNSIAFTGSPVSVDNDVRINMVLFVH